MAQCSEFWTERFVQAMVFGNMGNDCATGVAFTRNPSNGTNDFYGCSAALSFFFQLFFCTTLAHKKICRFGMIFSMQGLSLVGLIAFGMTGSCVPSWMRMQRRA